MTGRRVGRAGRAGRKVGLVRKGRVGRWKGPGHVPSKPTDHLAGYRNIPRAILYTTYILYFSNKANYIFKFKTTKNVFFWGSFFIFLLYSRFSPDIRPELEKLGIIFLIISQIHLEIRKTTANRCHYIYIIFHIYIVIYMYPCVVTSFSGYINILPCTPSSGYRGGGESWRRLL